MEPSRLLISRRSLQRRVRALAADIARDYEGRQPLFLGVLKGAFVFLADLTRAMDATPQIDFIQLSTYGLRGTQGAKRVRVVCPPAIDLQGRDVVIVEDIVDSGRTLRFLLRYVARSGPASLRVCALLVRSRSVETLGDAIDYKGFEIGDGWVVGYGLDYSERFRTLPDIYLLENA
jgi:hypoxanthine phosphoribosyltransferase